MYYSNKENSVRVDFFRETGKWYATEAIEIPDESYDKDIKSSLVEAIKKETNTRFVGMVAVCLNPFNVHSHPVMVKL